MNTTDKISMDDLVALCKRRGFIFPASEIYGGINGFWDFGPLGILLKNNLRDRWWNDMVITPPIGPNGEPLKIVGLDSSIIQNPKVWEASGHVGGFSDPMVDCRETKKRYRADHLIVYLPNELEQENQDQSILVFVEGTPKQEIEKKIKKLKLSLSLSQCECIPLTDLDKYGYTEDYGLWLLRPNGTKKVDRSRLVAPDVKKPDTLTEARQFNLMFESSAGAVKDAASKVYLRPETAQGCFTNYKNIVDNMRVRVPFGIAQIGKAFRNEVTPRNFIYRSREFEQMEMEWFCHPDEARLWFDFWKDERKKWWEAVGVSTENLQLRQHDQDELSHYAKAGVGTVDIEYRFPFTWPGFGELEGVAHRCDFDLIQHEKHSGKKMEYFDDSVQPPRRFLPHVIEPAAGLTRGVLALLAEAYTADPSRPSKMYLKFNPSIAPVKAAVLPLVNKNGLPEIAQKLYYSMRTKFMTEYDAKSNIGKRYARHDEIGTPFCITVDNDTPKDQAVTIRFRDTMAQERVALDKVEGFVQKALKE
ncbi:MAG: glycine--tRNA ligase [Alphaproteobacteria bacterium]|nr:glycine--tRNA ligase [Alphaproteobacteria bacterium]